MVMVGNSDLYAMQDSSGTVLTVGPNICSKRYSKRRIPSRNHPSHDNEMPVCTVHTSTGTVTVQYDVECKTWNATLSRGFTPIGNP
jgi:hypothetical protein